MITCKTVDFLSWKNCLQLSNGIVELIISTELGPRIISYRKCNGENFFKVYEDLIANTENLKETNEWVIFGGHRLWMAPEDAKKTYYPDFSPVVYSFDGKVLELNCEVELTTKLRKSIIIELDENTSRVKLYHRVYNEHAYPVRFSAWALSVMAPEGRVIVPRVPYVPHGKGENETLLPSERLILWPFTDMSDKRFNWGKKYITMREDSSINSPQKFGICNKNSWVAYAHHGELFVKYQDYVVGEEYPDYGCNAEFFTCPGMLEVETLGPLTIVEPNDYVELCESWEIFDINLSEEQDIMHEQFSSLKFKA